MRFDPTLLPQADRWDGFAAVKGPASLGEGHALPAKPAAIG